MLMTTTMVKLADICTDSKTQVRESVNQEKVNEYTHLLEEGVEFDPIELYNDGAKIHISSGWHRYLAHRSAGLTEIAAIVHVGTESDAFFNGIPANGPSPIPYNNLDYIKQLRRFQEDEERSQWSVSQKAKWMHCSRTTVNRLIKKIREDDYQGAKEATEIKPIKYTRNGKVQEMKRKPAAPPPDEPPPMENDSQVAEMVDTITSLEEKLRDAQDKIMVAQWDATDIEKEDVEETLSDLRNKIKLLEIENQALRDSRDSLQVENNQLMKTVRGLQTKLKKLEQ
jgi:FtsZ-binding cell division protein ZapB